MKPDGLMHYVAADPTGPIRQKRRTATQKVGTGVAEAVICSGNNLRVPCQPQRPYLARGVGRGKKFRLLEAFFATAQLYVERPGPDGKPTFLELVTCPRCKASALYKRDVAAYHNAPKAGGVQSLS